MRRRKFLVLVGVGTVTAGCGGEDTSDGDGTETDTPTEEETRAGTETPTDADTPTEEGTEPEPDTATENAENEDGSDDTVIVEGGRSHSFEGSGTDVTEEFTLADGIAAVEFSHDGDRNFIINMLDLEGDEFDDQLLVNVIGSIEGRSVVPVSDSRY